MRSAEELLEFAGALDDVRQALLEHHGLDQEEALVVVREALTRFVREKGLGEGLSDDDWLVGMQAARSARNTGLAFRPQTDSVILSSSGEYYANEVLDLANHVTDYAAFHSQLNQIQAQANAALTGEDSLVVWNTIDVTRYSATYWEQEMDEWIEVCTPNPELCEDHDDFSVPDLGDQIIPMGWIRDVGRVLCGDAVGAFWGAITSLNPAVIVIRAAIGSAAALVLVLTT